VGHVVRGRRKPAHVRWLPEKMLKCAQDAQGPAPRPSRQSGNQLPHQNSAVVRVRKTPTRNGMGRIVPERPHQRHTATTHLLSSVPTVSALLFAARRLIQRQGAGKPGERGQADVEADQRVAHQFQGFRQAVIRIYVTLLK